MSEYLLLDYFYHSETNITRSSKKSDVHIFSKYGYMYENYYHPEYGLYSEDERDTIAHVNGLIKKSRAYDKNVEAKEYIQFKADLLVDYKNYLTCLHSGTGKRKIFYALTRMLLSLNMVAEVYDVIKGHYSSDYHDGFDPDNMLDYETLFLETGDEMLFNKGNLTSAMKMYELASLEWPLSSSFQDYSGDYFGDDNGENEIASFSRQKAEKWRNTYRFYVQPYTTTSDIKLPETIQQNDLCGVCELYNQAMQALRSGKDPEVQHVTNKLFEYAKELKSKPSFIDNKDQARTLYVLLLSIQRKCLIPVLYCLSRQAKAEKLKYKDQVLALMDILKDGRYHAIWHYYKIFFNCGQRCYEMIMALVTVARLADYIQIALRVNTPSIGIAYYAPVQTFSYMLPEHCSGDKKDGCGKLTVMNLSYMNDPNEGKILKNAVFETSYKIIEPEARKEISVPYVFVKCFTSKIDYLPMWEMYGDHARGCCIVLDWDHTVQNSLAAETYLYYVCYMRHEGERWLIPQAENRHLGGKHKDIRSWLAQIKRAVKGMGREEYPYVERLLGSIMYLFKDCSYSYEEETRMIYAYDTVDRQFQHTNQKPPKLFVQPAFPIWISEIILGPKFDDINNHMPYFQEQIEMMCQRAGTKMPKISLSSIEYR